LIRYRLLACASFAAVAAFTAASAETKMTTTTTTPKPAAHAGAPAVAPLPASLASNPAIAEWTGPYGGVPAFDKVKPSDFPAAFDGALAMYRADIKAITDNPAAPTFENTIVALERAGPAFNRMAPIYGVWTSNMNDEAMQAVDKVISPKFAAASDEVIQNGKLFRRVEAVYNSPEKAKLTPEQQRLVWKTYQNFVRNGAQLNAEQKTRLAAVNQELAKLYTTFNQHLLADENTYIVVDSESDLGGVPASIVAGFKAAADEKKLPGKWVIANTRSSVDPFLTYSSNRALREQVWKAFKSRGDNGDANDNNATIAAIMPLRAEKAHLLGYKTYADWKLSNKMAKTPAEAQKLMLTVWKPAVARVHQEVADMQAVADKEGANLKIEPWDYLYYQEKVRKARYDLDQAQLKPYFQLDKMVEAAFWAAGELYGLDFKEITGQVPVFTPGVRVWEVTDGKGGKVGLFYGDYFARGTKQSGAWETAYRQQSRYDGVILPLVSNNNNFVKGAEGEPILISLDDAKTLFHEFGHAVHELLSNVNYTSLSGTNTATDFVEFPSQVNEHRVMTREVLDKFARHYKTGEPMPQALIDKVKNAETFNQGYATVEYLAAAIVDMDMHTIPDGKVDPDAFEREDLARIGMPHEIAMRHRVPQFGHLFSGEGYAAGYYSYLWSATMEADAWKAFTETGDPWNPAVSAKMKVMLSSGDTKDQAQEYRDFRGRDPDVNALLAQRGFPTIAPAAGGN
jgi:peptidyl-dipeptidase Dcp